MNQVIVLMSADCKWGVNNNFTILSDNQLGNQTENSSGFAVISIIVPVYNVEPYLRKCLDSIINQTYRKLEILVIDDGSTDGSGKICDEYKERDERVKVFHTENRGLSCARNLGLDEAQGEWIGFVDSDDWLEEYAIQMFLDTALSTDADIVACRFFQEYVNGTFESVGAKESFIAEGDKNLRSMLVERKMTEDVWNKFYRARLFNHIRYPEGRIFEDYATTYKLIQKSRRLTYIPDCLIHYRNRQNSLSNIHSMKSLVDYWTVYRERFDRLGKISDDYYRVTLSAAIRAVGRMWRWYDGCTGEEKRKSKRHLDEMRRFVEEHRREVLSGSYSRREKAICYYATHQNPLIFKFLYFMNALYRNRNRTTYFE